MHLPLHSQIKKPTCYRYHRKKHLRARFLLIEQMEIPELADLPQKDLQDRSCFHNVVVKEHLSLLPSLIGNLSKGITEHLSNKILKHSAQLKGVMMSYSKPTVMHEKGKILDEQPHIHFDVTYSATIFRPILGDVLCGTVNVVGIDHVGCLLYDCFNVTVVSRRSNDLQCRFPAGFEEQSTIWFMVTCVDTTGDLLSLTGEYFEGHL